MTLALHSEVEMKLLNKEFLREWGIPDYATEEAMGFDLRAGIDAHPATDSTTRYLFPGESIIIPTGFAVDLDNPYSVMFLLPRSGMGCNKGIVLGNLIGCIDSDYQGEVGVCVWNRNQKGMAFEINRGDKICQAAIVPVIRASFNVVNEFSRVTERGEAGYGSTGKN